MQKMGSKMSSLARGVGAASLLFSQGVKSDEVSLQPGTSLGQFPATSISELQNTISTQLVSDITPDSSFSGPDDIRWVLLKTDTGLSLPMPASYNGQVMHFGEQQNFFIRFDTETHLPEISTDLTNWQPYSSGTPIYVSRQEQGTFIDIAPTLQTLQTTLQEQQVLTETLVQQQSELAQVQAEVDALQVSLDQSSQTLTATNTTLTSKEQTQGTLETTLKPEAQLRTDTHPIVQNTALDDTARINLTQIALNAYDLVPAINTLSPQRAPTPTSTFVPPTAAEVQSTITLLTQELSRIQTQITTITSQITAKQNEINTTQNSINTTQQSLDQLTAQLTQYANDYFYWRDEYNRLAALRDSTAADVASLKSSYAADRSRLMSEGGRSDVPSNLDSSTITTEINSLKSHINSEMAAITVATNSWGTDTTTKNLPDAQGSNITRLGSSYYYYSDFASLTRSYPAILKVFFKPTGSSSFILSSVTYTVYNTNHLQAVINNTIKPLYNKSCDYTFADKILETEKENYLTKKTELNTYTSDAATAFGKRQTAQNNINSAQPLVDQRQVELTALNQQKATLTQQKIDLESLKNTKAQLQTLYNRVKTILDQLQQHVASHSAITAEITNLVNQAQQLETEISQLETSLFFAEGDEEILTNIVATTSDNLTTVRNSLTQTEQSLLALIQDSQNIRPQDSITRSGGALIPASEASKYFSYGFRTSQYSENIAGLPAKWIIQYANKANAQEIYPASASLQYTINGRAYRTDGIQINNFTHKELINGYLREAITQLNNSLAVLGSYPSGSSTGIENMLTAIKSQIAALHPSSSSNVTIKNHIAAVNAFKTKALLQGGTNAFFEHMLTHNAAFSLKIEQMTALMAQKGTIAEGTDAMNDLRHMVTTIFARAFAERLVFSGTCGLDIYAQWEQETLSFINGLGDESILTNELDMNSNWQVDDHGNKYKYGLFHPAGLGVYNPPATFFMMYSPDGTNTQVLGPVSVSSGAEADTMKTRWKEELLKMKRSHVENYSGGDYDVFRGTDETGEYVYWGKYVFGGQLYQTGFQKTPEATEGYMQDSLKNQMNILNQNRTNYYIFLNAWKNFLQNNQNLEASDIGELYVYCLIMIELYERADFRTVLFAEFPEFQNGGIQHIITLKNNLEAYGAELDESFSQLNMQLIELLTPEVKGALLAIKDFMEGYEELLDIQTYKDLIAFANDVFQSIRSGEILTDIVDTGHALYGILKDFDEIVYSWSDDDINQAKAYLATTIFLEYNPSGRASKVLSKGVKRISPKNTYIEMLSKAHLDLLARLSHKIANPITTLDHLGEVTQVAQLKKKIRATDVAERAELQRIRSLPTAAQRGEAGEEFIRRLTLGDTENRNFNIDGLGLRVVDVPYNDPLHGRIIAEVKTYEGNVPINDFHRLQLRKDQALELEGRGRPVIYVIGNGQDVASGYLDEATKNGIEVILITLD